MTAAPTDIGELLSEIHQEALRTGKEVTLMSDEQLEASVKRNAFKRVVANLADRELTWVCQIDRRR